MAQREDWSEQISHGKLLLTVAFGQRNGFLKTNFGSFDFVHSSNWLSMAQSLKAGRQAVHHEKVFHHHSSCSYCFSGSVLILILT